MGLVALATVADVVPLSDENRVLVRHGLAGIAGDPSIGSGAAWKSAGASRKKRLTSGTVGFVLGPRINAAGRLERAMVAVEMLTTDDAIRGARIASELDLCDARGREIETKVLEETRGMVEALGGVTDRRRDRAGRQGMARGRHRDRRQPAGRGVSSARPSSSRWGTRRAQGSARSIPGFDLYEAIKDCGDTLLEIQPSTPPPRA